MAEQSSPMTAEPVAWIVLSDDANNTRIWWRDQEVAEAWSRTHSKPLIPLYAHPRVVGDVLPLRAPATPAPGDVGEIVRELRHFSRSRGGYGVCDKAADTLEQLSLDIQQCVDANRGHQDTISSLSAESVSLMELAYAPDGTPHRDMVFSEAAKRGEAEARLAEAVEVIRDLLPAAPMQGSRERAAKFIGIPRPVEQPQPSVGRVRREDIHAAAKEGNLQFWRDQAAQDASFAAWKAGGFASECPQHLEGTLVDYITDAIVRPVE